MTRKTASKRAAGGGRAKRASAAATVTPDPGIVPGHDSARRAASVTDEVMSLWNPGLRDPNTDWGWERDTAVARTRDLVANDGQAQAAVDQAVSMQVGVSFRYSARSDLMAHHLGISTEAADNLATQIERAWDSFANDKLGRCDWGGELNFGQMTNLVARHKFVDGEALAVLRFDKGKLPDGWKWRTAVQLLDPDRLQNPNGRRNDAKIVNGVETDGRRVTAYHIRNAHPADGAVFADRFTFERVPASEAWGRPIVLHVHDKKRAGERRGVSRFVAVLRKFKQLQDYSDKELASAALNAMFGAYIKTTKPAGEAAEALGVKQLQELGAMRKSFYKGVDPRLGNGSRISVLAPGDEFALNSTPRHVASYDGFMKTTGRAIAVSLGITGSSFIGDFTGMSFSTWRAEILPVWRQVLQDRDLIASQFCDRVLLAVVEEGIDNGEITPPEGCPGLYECTHGWLAGRWIGPPRGTIDPANEITAATDRIAAGLSSHEDEALDLGRDDYRGLAGQLAYEVEMFEEKGLMPTAVAQLTGQVLPAGSPAPPQPEPAPEEGAPESPPEGGDQPDAPASAQPEGANHAPDRRSSARSRRGGTQPRSSKGR